MIHLLLVEVINGKVGGTMFWSACGQEGPRRLARDKFDLMKLHDVGVNVCPDCLAYAERSPSES